MSFLRPFWSENLPTIGAKMPRERAKQAKINPTDPKNSAHPHILGIEWQNRFYYPDTQHRCQGRCE